MNADNIFELLTSYIDPVVILDVDNAVLCCLETKLQQKGQRFSRLPKNQILSNKISLINISNKNIDSDFVRTTFLYKI